MAENSKIEWTDHTFNPFIGCTKISPACDNCYAENLMDTRMGKVVWGPKGERVRTSPTNWRKPLAWNANHEAFAKEHGRRQRVFCASLADVFDNAVDPQWRADLFALIQATPNLDWLLLTKRIGNVERQLDEAIHHIEALPDWGDEGPHRLAAARDMMANWVLLRKPPQNIWLGATITSREEMLRDGPKLKAIPARVHFWSVEPFLGYLGEVPRELLPDWVIAGGESGPNARPMHPGWARSLRDQCNAADVAFLFKQWGEWTSGENVLRQHGTVATAKWWNDTWSFHEENLAYTDGHIDDEPDLYRVGKKAAGRLLDGRTWDGFPAP